MAAFRRAASSRASSRPTSCSKRSISARRPARCARCRRPRSLLPSNVHVRIHATEARSRANGPGARFVVWMQGCTLGCPGCFNPTTHDAGGGREVDVADLAAELAATANIEGLTLSGGEPLQQPDAAAALLAAARALGLSTLVFSGY